MGLLSGYKVLELGHYIAAPHCAMMLADQGAEVIKIEPPQGDPGRRAPPFNQLGESLAFACHNRGKRSVTLDLAAKPHGRALDALLRWADLVVTNYALGVPEKLGFGFRRLSKLNARACMVHITGYGPSGVRRDFGAFDPTIQAMSGFSDLTGDPNGPPQISQFFLADHSAAIHAAYAGLCLLLERARTGRGRKVDISMLETMTSQLSYHVPSKGVFGESPTRRVVPASTGLPTVYRTKDAPIVVMLGTPSAWLKFSRLMRHPEWAPDPSKSPKLAEDPVLYGEVLKAVTAWFAAHTSAEAFQTLHAAGLVSGVFRSVSQMYDEEIAAGSGAITFVRMAGSGELAPTPGLPFRPASSRDEPPTCPGLGDHTQSVLRELDVDPPHRKTRVRRPRAD